MKTQPDHGGSSCSTTLEETANCNSDPCSAASCQASDWGEWSSCTLSCGDGVKTRTRTLIKQGQSCTLSLNETALCNNGKCKPPSGPIPPDIAGTDQVHSSTSLDAVTKQHVALRTTDGVTVKTTLTVTREIAQEEVHNRPWSMYVQTQRGLLATAVEHGVAKEWALFVRSSQMSGCVIQNWADMNKELSNDQCRRSSKTFDCFKLDTAIAKANITNSSSIYIDPILRNQCMHEVPDGHVCEAMHKALLTSA